MTDDAPQDATAAAVEPGDDGPRTALDRLIGRAGGVVCWLVFISMAISVYEVFMRYGLDSPTSWVHETTVFLIAVTFALGGPVALARNRHIRVRLLYDTVSSDFRRWLDVFNDAVTVLFCTGMSYAAWVMFYKATHSPLGGISLERSGTSWNPPFPAFTKTMILCAIAIMALQAVLHLIQSLRGVRAGKVTMEEAADGH